MENKVEQFLLLWHLERNLCTGSGERGHIVADNLLPTQIFPCLPERATFVCGHKFCVRDTKNVSDFVQKHFVCPRNVS